MDAILLYLIASGFLYVGIPLIYIFSMRYISLNHSWNVRKDPYYMPKVDIILPTYNEEKAILQKLRDLSAVDYPKELMRTIIVDSGSTDNTLMLERMFAKENSDLEVIVIEEGQRTGKSKALNIGLSVAEGEVVVTTDAGDFWEPDVLNSILQYLADPSVGAVAGTEEILNPSQSSATKSEVAYRRAHNYMRLGESKMHSTLVLHGGLTAYKRHVLDRFDEVSGSDDMGTPLTIVKKGFRCILIPEVKSRYNDYFTWKGKMTAKVRRAQQMIEIWLRCFVDFLKGEIRMSTLTVIANVYIHVVNPIIGLLFYTFALVSVVRYPLLTLPFLAISTWKVTREYMLSFIVHNAFLVVGLINNSSGGKQRVWSKIEETHIACPEYKVDYGCFRGR